MDCTPSGRCSVVLWIVAALCLVSAGSTTTTAQRATSFSVGWQRGTPVSVSGVVTAIVGDDFAHNRSELVHLIRDERTGRSFELRFDGPPPANLRSGARATVRGRADTSTIYVAAADGTGMTIQSSTAAV